MRASKHAKKRIPDKAFVRVRFEDRIDLRALFKFTTAHDFSFWAETHDEGELLGEVVAGKETEILLVFNATGLAEARDDGTKPRFVQWGKEEGTYRLVGKVREIIDRIAQPDIGSPDEPPVSSSGHVWYSAVIEGPITLFSHFWSRTDTEIATGTVVDMLGPLMVAPPYVVERRRKHG